MQTPTPSAPRRERRRAQVSCTECRRRKQKCISRKDGPCTNCLRRYPPVECYVQELGERSTIRGSAKQAGIGSEVGREPFNPRRAFSSGVAPPAIDFPQGQPSLAIPLSRVLHPVHDTLPYHKPTLAVRGNSTSNLQSSSPTGSIVEDSELDANATPTQRRLKFLDPGPKDVMHKRLTTLESPTPFGGILTMLNSFNAMPVKTSFRNTELFHFFHQYVVPRLCSIDGSNIPPLFAREILPWMIQSPMMPNIAILMASATQSHLHQSEAERYSETLIIKTHVLSLVNRFIQEDFFLVGNQALRIVIHLVVIEFFWGSAESVWPHMEGIKQMLKVRGGLEGMDDPLNMHVLIVTDYELACGFERELYLQTTETAIATELLTQDSYPERFRCPLLAYPTTFRDCREALNLSLTAAEILDGVRFLTISISSCLLSPELEPIKTSKIQSTAEWLHKRIEAIPEATIISDTDTNDIIFDTIRLTALVYTSSIKSLTPMSRAFTSSLQERLYSNLSLVGLSNWKDIPGIFFWILLVATPSSSGDFRGRFLRKQMACTGMSIGLEDFNLGTAYLRAFWVVQRWIDSERLKATVMPL